MRQDSLVVEPSAHNALVGGSIPSPVTILACSSVVELTPDKREVGRSIRPRPTNLPRIRLCDVKIIVAAHFGLLPSDLNLTKNCDRTNWWPRMLSMILAHQLTDFSCNRIGKAFHYKRPRSIRNSILAGLKKSQTDPDVGMLFSVLALQIIEDAVRRNAAIAQWAKERGPHPYKARSLKE